MFRMIKKDDALWFKHLVLAGAIEVCDYCAAHEEGEVFHLVLNGEVTAWTRAEQGKNPKPTMAVKPADKRNPWHRILKGDQFEIGLPREIHTQELCTAPNSSISQEEDITKYGEPAPVAFHSPEPVTNMSGRMCPGSKPACAVADRVSADLVHLSLGIDAAWTADNASGVALLGKDRNGNIHVLTFAGSYAEFINGRLPTFDGKDIVTGSWPSIDRLLNCVVSRTGRKPNAVSLDLPLSPQPIVGRREADRQVSRHYGSKGAGTHSPSAERPGPISSAVFNQLTSESYKWVGCERCDSEFVFLETYPHVVIIEMLELDYRLPYKVDKIRSYWPKMTSSERHIALCSTFDLLRDGLVQRIRGLSDLLPNPSILVGQADSAWKKYEDVLDALVCAWLGCEFLSNRTMAYGDSTSGIWAPLPSNS